MPFDAVTYGAAAASATAQNAAQASQLAAIPNTGVGGSLTLTVLGWSANVQAKAAAGVTATNYVTVSPASGYEAAYLAAGITVAQTADTLTFTCTSTPAVPINVIYIVPSTSFNSVRYYTNVAGMVADTTLKVGDVCQTKGYYTANDGGDGLYNIVAAATGTANGGTFIDLSGISGQAKLVVGKNIDIMQFGARTGSYAAANTTAITAAIAAGDALGKPVIVPQATFVINGVSLINCYSRLVGANKYGSILRCTQAGAACVTLNKEMQTVCNLTIQGNGTANLHGSDATNGDGILFNGVGHEIQDSSIYDCVIENNGGDGIRFTGGCWTNFFHGLIVRGNKRDGVNITGDDGAGQKNSLHFHHNIFSGNGRNGVFAWGCMLTVDDNSIEQNIGAGISVDCEENLTNFGNYGVNGVEAHGNYFEHNGRGSLFVRGGKYMDGATPHYRYVHGVRFSGNYIDQVDEDFAALPCADITFDCVSEGRIYGCYVGENTLINSSCTTRFQGDALLNKSNVFKFDGDSDDTYQTAFTALGNAQYPTLEKTLVINGFWHCSGATYATYNGLSDDIAAGTVVRYPLQLPVGAIITQIGVYVSTDSTDWGLDIYLGHRSPHVAESYTETQKEWASVKHNGAFDAVTTTDYTAAYRVPDDENDMYIKFVPTRTNAGSYLKFAFPYIKYIM